MIHACTNDDKHVNINGAYTYMCMCFLKSVLAKVPTLRFGTSVIGYDSR